MKLGRAPRRVSAADHADRRLIGGLVVSLLLHGLVLLLQFGVPGLGVPGAPPPLTVVIARADTPPPPIPLPDAVVAPPVPALPRPVTGMRLVDPAPAPAPAPSPPVAKATPKVVKGKPRRARRISSPVQGREMLVEPERVIAQNSTLNDFVVPLSRPEEAEQKTIDSLEAQPGEDEGDAAASAAEEAAAAQAGKLKAEAEARALKLAEDEEKRALEEKQRLAALENDARKEAEEQAARQLAEHQAQAEQSKADEARRQEAQLAQAEQEKTLKEQQLAQQLRLEQQKQEREKAELQKAELQKAEQQLVERQRELQQQEQQKAEQRRIAEQQRAEQQRAEQQRAEQQRVAEQQRAEQQRAEQQRAEQQRIADQRAADQRAADQRAADQRGRELANAQPASGAGTAGAGAGGAGGKVQIPKNMMGSDLANRARDLVKGIDVLRGAPPQIRAPGERRAVVGASERDLPLKMYVESWRQKLERNGSVNYPRSWADIERIDPLVSVAVRSDGSVEDVTILVSSGRADMDEAVRRIVRVNARYSPFPPAIAERYDVIEVRRVWSFGDKLKLMEELR